ncbi:MAG: response regulator transcription factor [Flavobacterium sp.]|nr:MAG: response regulator transcription factor [Flavobacterium sp.]
MLNEPIHCLIIDDEPLARQLLRNYINAKDGYIIVGECATATAAYELLLNNKIDVIFLDIQMPELNGIEFLLSLRKPPAIIFTTAFDQYAATAFDLNVVDYLMKPITLERFEQALLKLQSNFNKVPHPPDQPTSSDPVKQHVFFKTDGRLVKVMLKDILYLEADKDFTRIFIRNQEPLFIGDHLKAVESHLPQKNFRRIHRSYSVMLAAITGIFGNTVEIGDIQLPIGLSYKQPLLDELNIK